MRISDWSSDVCSSDLSDPRFLDNRLRIQNAAALDDALQAAMEKFDRDELLALLEKFDAAVAPCHNIKEIFEDPHYQARENIVAVEDAELGGPIRMQNIIGKFSRTQPSIRSAGPRLGEHNREILVEQLGFDEARSEEHTSEIQSLMSNPYAVLCL